ncbi:MAG: DUF3408 domain-containing protein [Paludibacter sp.]|uniref:DUF3408 domain-containing protein n=1 Tax=Dysgonomonas sp. HDW5A TaxID=2714926 RepID=UPI00140C2E63|nr:DUF3408 domain-containing protein [Dysgonomonas sp. HDW5A]MBP6663171.1 DUF3408 domain-containing protein [Paludibacter sp.]MBP9481778.1 DUF3408 domain-containing protein [Parabacteroides sp.]MBP7613506.1 DUF3408 domain-containing protein [Paludibacter sp.]MBP9579683.1 DUF3408 domain-containing protein [Parabacteroides sp.]QIK61581.1 DUF3408 domain-containing protein [Dysgonomonas sp. HDW5A]
MNSKQTDNGQQKKTMPEDWSPVPSVERKPSTPKSNNESKEELLKEFLGMEDSSVVDIGASKENANRGIGQSIQTEDEINTKDSMQTEPVIDTRSTVKRISSKQRKESLEEYQQTFLSVPTLEDRKPVFISREIRDSLDEIVRKLGGRRMSVSGFIENLARHHLEIYQDDVELWKKL